MAKEQSLNFEVFDRHIILFMGPGKSGKTSTAFNLFGRENTSVLSYDVEGLKPIRPVTSCFVIDLQNAWKDTWETLPELKKVKQTTILVDDLTHAGNAFFAEARRTSRHNNKMKMYGDAIEHLRDLMDYLKYNLPDKHIVYTCTSRIVVEDDDDEKIRLTMPNVIGKDTFAQEIPARVDHLFFMLPPVAKTRVTKDQKGRVTGKQTLWERKILTQSTGSILAGNRMNQAGGEQILTLEEEVTIGEGLSNIEALRNKLLQKEGKDG